jgi:hypothetical protein
VFADKPWYIARPEPEMRREGVLAPHRQALGPASRGGLDFVLTGRDGTDLVYCAGVEDQLARLAGRSVVARGKLVLIDGGVELWIGSIEPR